MLRHVSSFLPRPKIYFGIFESWKSFMVKPCTYYCFNQTFGPSTFDTLTLHSPGSWSLCHLIPRKLDPQKKYFCGISSLVTYAVRIYDRATKRGILISAGVFSRNIWGIKCLGNQLSRRWIVRGSTSLTWTVQLNQNATFGDLSGASGFTGWGVFRFWREMLLSITRVAGRILERVEGKLTSSPEFSQTHCLAPLWAEWIYTSATLEHTDLLIPTHHSYIFPRRTFFHFFLQIDNPYRIL